MRLRPSCLFLCTALCFGLSAWAQDPPESAESASESATESIRESTPEDSRRAEARRLAQKGDQSFTIGRCDKAIPLWEQANENFYAPTILFRIARCQALLGNVVEATKTLEAIVARPPAPDEPAPFAAARKQANKELPNLRARIAELRIEVDRRDLDVAPRVFVDRKAVTAGAAVLQVNPGEHQIRVEARDQLWERSIDAEEGKVQTIRVALGEVYQSPPPRTQRTVGFVIGGIGLAALATGAYFGASAATTSRELDGVCGGNRKACPPDRQDDIDRLRTHALVADVTIGGGAALFAAGSIVVLTEKLPKHEEPRIEFFPLGAGGGVRARF